MSPISLKPRVDIPGHCGVQNGEDRRKIPDPVGVWENAADQALRTNQEVQKEDRRTVPDPSAVWEDVADQALEVAQEVRKGDRRMVPDPEADQEVLAAEDRAVHRQFQE